MHILTFALSLIVVGCASQTPEGETPEADRALDSSPQYRYAVLFDRYVKGEASADDTKNLFESCLTRKDNPFCPSLKRRKELDRRLRAFREIPKPAVIKPIPQIAPKFVNGKVTNWRQLRRARVRSLLDGLETMSLADLKGLAGKALAEKKCPNSIASAVAATMENFLPDQVSRDEIAQLYRKGGLCLPKSDDDRDHFLIRAGLFAYWQKDYKDAAEFLGRVPSSDAYLGRHLYWLYRARKQLGDSAKAELAATKLRKTHRYSFHATLLSLGLGEEPLKGAFADAPLSLKRSNKARGINSFIEQAEILHGYQFWRSGHFLVEWALARHPKIEPALRLYVLSLADPTSKVDWLPGILLRTPSLLSKQAMELNYPIPDFKLFDRHANGIDPYLLLALARKESKFDPLAISPAKAQGLLQLMPETATRMGGGENPNLLDPAINIDLGSKYLSQLLRLHRGQVPLALASYNAGEEAVARWEKRYVTDDPVLFIDLIPYRETREYVGFVLNNYYWYTRLNRSGTTVAALKDLVSSEIARK